MTRSSHWKPTVVCRQIVDTTSRPNNFSDARCPQKSVSLSHHHRLYSCSNLINHNIHEQCYYYFINEINHRACALLGRLCHPRKDVSSQEYCALPERLSPHRKDVLSQKHYALPGTWTVQVPKPMWMSPPSTGACPPR